MTRRARAYFAVYVGGGVLLTLVAASHGWLYGIAVFVVVLGLPRFLWRRRA